MALHVPSSSSHDFSLRNGPLSNLPGVRRRQISRINAYVKGNRFNAKKNRMLRKAEYKKKLAQHNLPDNVKKAIKDNPLMHGAPRNFKILVAGNDVASEAKLQDHDRYKDEGHIIHFAAFGIPGKQIMLNGHWIKTDGSELSADKRIYTLSTIDEKENKVDLYLDFTQMQRPTGHISLPNGMLALSLQPFATSFNVNVAADAGAYLSTATSSLIWDETSTTWQNATWENNSMVFSYDTVSTTDAFDGRWLYNEVAFQDNKAGGAVFELDQPQYGSNYTSIFEELELGDGTQKFCCLTTVTAGDVLAPPSVRTGDAIKSVYPQLSLFAFDDTGMNFTGAFIIPSESRGVPDTVYAASGTSVLSNSPSFSASPPKPQKDSVKNNVHELYTQKPLFCTAVAPVPHPFGLSATTTNSPLSMTGLLNLDPMIADPANPGSYIDSVSQLANADFHSIICYYMDPDIHTTFISASPTILADSTIQAIATDSGDNEKFYKSLQVPYVVSSLGNSTVPEGNQCNVKRAEAQLKTLPSNSPVYQRHSDALYRHRYMEKFPQLQDYLNDQINTDYSTNIANGAAAIKTKISSLASGVSGTDPQTNQDTLSAALADIDSLTSWANDNKLFYAYDLYEWAATFLIPQLLAQESSGTLSSSVSQTLKKITLVLGVLEGGLQNPNGKSFTEAFNGLMQLFQMQSIIPQFIDADGASEDIDSIQKEMLQQFYTDNIGSTDPNVVAEAERAQQLASNDVLRQTFFNSLATSMRMAGSLGNWAAVCQTFDSFNNAAAWYQKLVGAADVAATFLRVSCVALLVLPMISKDGGGWNAMSTEEKTSWTITCSGLALTFFIKGIQGALRVVSFWSDISGFVQASKAFLGFSKVLEDLPATAEATSNTLARWFLRTGPETMEITGDEVTLGMKIFGRSAGEFLTNCVGAILAGVNIVMSAIDLSKTTDPLQKDMDILMIVSSGLQLLAIGASWAVTSGAVAGEVAVGVLETVAACAGPFAVVFAIAGLVVMIVLSCMQKTPPNPVQDFIDKDAAPADLKMDYLTAIDYFNIVPSDSTAASLNGISFQGAVGATSGFLQLGNQINTSAPAYAVQATSAITYLPDTCWCVATDSNGLTTIFTYILDQNLNKITLCLSEPSEGEIQAVPPPASTVTDSSGKTVPVDPTVYQSQIAQQQWTVTALSSATSVTRVDGTETNTFMQSASFSITRNDKTLYFVTDDSGNGSVVLASDPPQSSSGSWTLTLQSMGPSGFTYIHEVWNLTTEDTDEINSTEFYGTTSMPLNCSISPALPSCLQLMSADGSIQQTPETKAPAMPATIYTVTASITILGKLYSQSSSVTISVVDPAASSSNGTGLALVNGDDTSFTSSVAAQNFDGMRSRFVNGNSTPMHSQNNSRDALTKSQSRSHDTFRSTASEASPNMEKLQRRYDALMADAPPYIEWIQCKEMFLNEHYTGQLAVAKMQNSVTGAWRKMNSPYSYQDIPYENIYFPSPPATPPPSDNDPCDYQGGADAYVAQAIYNGDSRAQPVCKLNDAQNTINNFNNSLWAFNTQVFLEWLKWDQSYAITGTPCTYDEYVTILTSPDWIAFHRAMQANGGWPDQAKEMYFHFLKLTALGATSSQITSIYNTLTGPTALDPGDFPNITPTTWMDFRGYLATSPILFSQLGVQNLNQVNYYYVDPEDTGTQYADTSFLRATGYWQAPPSGCCFPAGTRIVLADYKSTVAIEDIKPGEKVLSPTATNEKATKTVQFVSRPRQAGRPLYSIDPNSDVRFTATHPIYLGQSEDSSPIIGFVDVNAALQLNPLWDAFCLESLPIKTLTLTAPVDADAVLFDLILDQGSTDSSESTVSSYVIETASGHRLSVCSDAPDITALPEMTRFVVAFVQAIGERHDTARFFPEGLRSGVLDYYQYIFKHRAASVETVQANISRLHEKSRFGPRLALADAMSALSAAKPPVQALMDATEAITECLGLSLQCHLDNGWHFWSNTTSVSKSQDAFVITTHFLSLAHTTLLSLSDDMASNHKTFLRSLVKSLTDAPCVSVQLSNNSTDQATISSNPKPRRIGPYLYRLAATMQVESTALAHVQNSTSFSQSSYKISIVLTSGLVLVAQGTVTPDVPAKWPLYIKSSGVQSRELSSHQCHHAFHVGWLILTGATVSKEVLELSNFWSEKSMNGDTLSYMELYAEELGSAVGKDVITTIYGQS